MRSASAAVRYAALTEKYRQPPPIPFNWCSPRSVNDAFPASIKSRTVEEVQSSSSAERLPVQARSHGHANGVHVNVQLTTPTSHCAMRSASPMLQPPSRLTSHRSGWLNGVSPHRRSPTSYWATTSASPMLTTASPFTSPQPAPPIVVVVVLLVVVVAI